MQNSSQYKSRGNAQSVSRKLCPTCCKNHLLCMFVNGKGLCMECRNLRGLKIAKGQKFVPPRLLKREQRLRASYGIGFKKYERIFHAQDGRCAICRVKGNLDPSKKLPFHVDHDHATGKVRGLLCTRCNIGLGMMKENAENLENAKAYLASITG